MKRIFVTALLFPFAIHAQEITSPQKDRRLYINPLNILIGDFEVSYCWKTGNNFFLEPTIGYHYFPFSIKQNGFATLGESAEPELGLGYYGLYVRFAVRTYFTHDKNMFIKPEVFYKIQNHKPACYAETDAPSKKYSGERQGVGARVLLGFDRDPSRTYSGKFIVEGYVGAGAKFYWGTLKQYAGGNYDQMCNDPVIQESTSDIRFTSFFPAIYLGFRIGWQLAKDK